MNQEVEINFCNICKNPSHDDKDCKEKNNKPWEKGKVWKLVKKGGEISNQLLENERDARAEFQGNTYGSTQVQETPSKIPSSSPLQLKWTPNSYASMEKKGLKQFEDEIPSQVNEMQ